MAVATSSAGSDSAVLERSPLVPTDHRDSPPKATLTPPGCQPRYTRCRPVRGTRCVEKWHPWWWSDRCTQHAVGPAEARQDVPGAWAGREAGTRRCPGRVRPGRSDRTTTAAVGQPEEGRW